MLTTKRSKSSCILQAVIPAKAGIHVCALCLLHAWILAFARMTLNVERTVNTFGTINIWKDEPKLVVVLLWIPLLVTQQAFSKDSVTDIAFSALLESELAIETDSGETQKLEIIFKPKLEVKLENGMKVTAIGRLRLDEQDQLEFRKNGADPAQDAISKASKRAFVGSKGEAELREFYLETTIGKSYLTLGKQQIVWGKADGLKVLDVVNPQSFREFILDDFEDSRIPLWSLNLEIPIKDDTLQLLLIPDQTKHEFSEAGSSFAFTSPRLVPASPSAGAGLTVIQKPVNKPSSGLGNADVGMRWTAFKDGWDLSLNYLYHYDDLPTLYQRRQGSTITIDPQYDRSHLLGGTFTKSFSDLTLRGELGYSTDKHFLSGDPAVSNGVVESDEFSTVIGLDYSGISDTFLSGQVFQSRVLDDTRGLTRPKNDTTLTFLARRMFSNDTLEAEILWLANTNDGDGLIRPKLSYDIKDDVKAWVGADIFYGDKEGLFGQFGDKDRIVLGVEVGF